MVMPSSSSPTRILVRDPDSTGEVRMVSLLTRADGTVLLRETTTGPLTEAIFGCRSRYHEVVIAQTGIAAIEAAHQHRLAPGVLGGFFASGLAYLSDLMDELDGLGIAYSYVSCLPTGDAYFRPTSTCLAGE